MLPSPESAASWESLANSAPGCHALILGKGPSLDTWIDHGCPLPTENSEPRTENRAPLLIGINDVTATLPDHIRVPWSVSTHRLSEWQSLPTRFIVSLPACHGVPMKWDPEQWLVPDWAAHSFLHILGPQSAAVLTRAQIAATHILANQSSSSQPALHFAWYLGAEQITLVGIDGPGPDAQHYGRRHHAYIGLPSSHPGTYSGMKRDTEALATTLFGTRWQHWGPP